jgi:2-keto-4-pentenoate hydratase/2-oxohepta-3-ene-1,7-dioic acid hydratase in catechol pathway
LVETLGKPTDCFVSNHLFTQTLVYFSEHAKELGNAVPKSPFFFLKPTSSYLANGGTIEIPSGCDVHHESK